MEQLVFGLCQNRIAELKEQLKIIQRQAPIEDLLSQEISIQI